MIDITNELSLIYDLTSEQLITLDIPFKPEKGVMARCHKSSDVYIIECTESPDDLLNKMLKMHEYGHIYLGHLEGIHEEIDKKLIKVIRNKDSILIDLINKNCGIDYASDLLDKIISNPFMNHMVHNISMDMEINSSILNMDDITYMSNSIANIMNSELEKLMSKGVKNVKDINKLINTYKNSQVKGVHPSDLGFPEGLTYPDYLVLSILNLDKLMNLLSNISQGEGEGDSEYKLSGKRMDGSNLGNVPKSLDEFTDNLKEIMSGSNGNSSDADDSNDPKDGGNNGEKSESDKSESSSNSESSESDKSDKPEKGSSKSSGDSEDKSDDEDSGLTDHSTDERKEADERKSEDLGKYESSGGIGRGLDNSNSIRDVEVNNDPLDMALDEIIRDYRNKVIKRDFQRDFTYKYNRKILGKSSNVLSPSYRQKLIKTEDPTIAFVIDTSGSMDTRLVDKCITTIKNKMKKISRSLTYSIISWDTQLRYHYKDINCNTNIPKISCGGGTRLAGSFDLFKSEYGMDSIMILISDFEDDLNEWKKKESNMKGYTMYGLNYGYYKCNEDFKYFKVKECKGNGS